MGSQGRLLRLFQRSEAQRLMRIYVEMLKVEMDEEAFYEELQQKYNKEAIEDKEVWEVKGQVYYMTQKLKAGKCCKRNFFRNL